GFTISSALAKELMKYRDQRREISFVRLDRAQMRENLPVSNKELKEFLAKPENKEKVKTTFTAKKPSLDQKLEVQASHILLKTAGKKEADVKKKIDDIYKKLTPKNFKSMANKHTEDSNTEPTTGIKMGGSLGWFGAGKMVAPFWDAAKALKKNGISKPVKTKFGYHIIHVTGRKEEKQAKYEDHERELALDIIRNSKGDELGKFMKEIQADAQKHLLSGNTKALDRLSKKYNLKFTKTAEVNRLTGYKGDVTLKPEQVKSIFSKSLNEVHTFEEPVGTTVLIAKKEVTVAQPEASSKLGKQEVEKTKLDIARVISRTLRQNMMNNVQKEVRVWKTNKLNQL
ncbi:MAG: peptidylprolyl isomerase, partial [Bacteriovoracaceae bacterium]